MSLRACAAYVVIAAADYAYQRHTHDKQLKMTKEEVKQEFKNQEMSAEVRGARKRRQMESARARMMQDVPEADVVVTNPTHYAVALKYAPDKPAPIVVAKGKDLIAFKIRELAAANGVPVVPDPPLARSLHASVEVGHMIPEELYAAVAQLLAFVFRTAGRRRLHHHDPGRRMSSLLNRLGKHTDLLAAGGVVLIVVMLVIPLPPQLLDVFIALNIAAALAILTATIYLPRALDFSVFPTLLLITTMFRLAINVSVTRLILLHGDAGHMVEAFGEFVVGGNVVVGLIIFTILVVIQFVVVTNGAGRVAEVAARFTLDAMPGKQMAIDADLNAGQITDEQARTRRDEVAQEAEFYGAMDGASKFVKGDAIAAVIITLVNLVGGMIVGVAQQGMSMGEAAHTFSLLTVGDGLAAQIPALLVSVATGILVTRSASERDLGGDIAAQISANRKAPMVAGVVVCMFGLVPGLPKIPFFVVGAGFIFIGWRLKKQARPRRPPRRRPRSRRRAGGRRPARPARRRAGRAWPSTRSSWRSASASCRSSTRRPAARCSAASARCAASWPPTSASSSRPVRIHDEMALDSHEYVVRVRGTEVARSRITPGHLLAMDPGDAFGQLAGLPTIEPAFGLPACGSPREDVPRPRLWGTRSWTPSRSS
jgi:flagellar biosynthesis protein FlhA